MNRISMLLAICYGVLIVSGCGTNEEVADWNNTIKLDPSNAHAYYNRGVSYYVRGETEKALADYNKAIELNIKYASAYVDRGSIYDRRGETEKALADYNKAVSYTHLTLPTKA